MDSSKIKTTIEPKFVDSSSSISNTSEVHTLDIPIYPSFDSTSSIDNFSTPTQEYKTFGILNPHTTNRRLFWFNIQKYTKSKKGCFFCYWDNHFLSTILFLSIALNESPCFLEINMFCFNYNICQLYHIRALYYPPSPPPKKKRWIFCTFRKTPSFNFDLNRTIFIKPHIFQKSSF